MHTRGAIEGGKVECRRDGRSHHHRLLWLWFTVLGQQWTWYQRLTEELSSHSAWCNELAADVCQWITRNDGQQFGAGCKQDRTIEEFAWGNSRSSEEPRLFIESTKQRERFNCPMGAWVLIYLYYQRRFIVSTTQWQEARSFLREGFLVAVHWLHFIWGPQEPRDHQHTKSCREAQVIHNSTVGLGTVSRVETDFLQEWNKPISAADEAVSRDKQEGLECDIQCN